MVLSTLGFCLIRLLRNQALLFTIHAQKPLTNILHQGFYN